jgi:TolB protein
LLHHGPNLTSVETVSGEQTLLSANASAFRVAASSHDGEVTVFAEAGDAGTAVISYHHLDGARTGIAKFDGGAALAFRPGTSELTVAITTGAEAGVFRDLYTVTLVAGSEPRRIVHGPLLAYWWAPSGDRLAVLVPAYTGDGRYQVRFHGPDGRFLRAMEPLTLSPDMRTMVSFFDQFALSHRLWSPDGRRFAFAGRVLTDSIPASFADGQLDAVMVADAVDGGPWQRVGPGFAGFFPPREVNGG